MSNTFVNPTIAAMQRMAREELANEVLRRYASHKPELCEVFDAVNPALALGDLRGRFSNPSDNAMALLQIVLAVAQGGSVVFFTAYESVVDPSPERYLFAAYSFRDGVVATRI
jgi:hypothetical protein